MTETEFLARIDAILDSLESQSDDWVSLYGLDIEASRSGRVLTRVFNDAVHIVINSQTPMRELWVAAPGGGFHYRFDGKMWNDTRAGPHLAEALSQISSPASGRPIKVII